MAGPEYGDPVEFFGRTYLTRGLRYLLEQSIKRLSARMMEQHVDANIKHPHLDPNREVLIQVKDLQVSFGTGRKMAHLRVTDEEAKALVAYLKWVSSIDTNGFPYNFKTIQQGG